MSQKPRRESFLKILLFLPLFFIIIFFPTSDHKLQEQNFANFLCPRSNLNGAMKCFWMGTRCQTFQIRSFQLLLHFPLLLTTVWTSFEKAWFYELTHLETMSYLKLVFWPGTYFQVLVSILIALCMYCVYSNSSLHVLKSLCNWSG